MTNHRPPAPSGFTLIEIMVVVAIIGLLASMAVPGFQRMTLRAQAAERAVVMNTIGRAIAEAVSSRQGLPDPANKTFWIGVPNPPGAPGPLRRMFQPGLAGWTWLPDVVEGATYYSYSFVALAPPAGAATLMVVATGDLDGDGAVSTKVVNWVSAGWALSKDPGPLGELPPAGMEDIATFGTF